MAQKQKHITVFLNESESYNFHVKPNTNFTQLLENVEEEVMILLPQHQYKFILKNNKKIVRMNDSVSSTTYSKSNDTLILHLSPYISSIEKTRVFGIALDLLLKREQETMKSELSIPIVMDMCMKFVDKYGMGEVGVFRLSGSMNQTEKFIRQFNSGIKMKPFKPSTDCHVVSGLIKRFLRDMPDPLLTSERYNDFKELFSNRSLAHESKIEQLRNLVQSLPDSHYNLLQHLCALLNKIGFRYPVETKMNVENLSIVIGPNIMRSTYNEQNNQLFELADTPKICQCCSYLIEYYSQIFKEDSQFDAKLLGYEKYVPSQMPQSSSLSAHSTPLSESGKNTTKSGMFISSGGYVKGHIPRSIYDPLSNEEKSFRLDSVKILGESIAFYSEIEDTQIRNKDSNKWVVDREIPFDHIQTVKYSESEGLHFISIYYSSKVLEGTVHICDKNKKEIVAFQQDIERSRVKYNEFIEKAVSQPEKYGIVMTKDEFRSKKKKKNEGKHPDAELKDKSSKKKLMEIQQQLEDETQRRKYLEHRCMELEEEVKELREQLTQILSTKKLTSHDGANSEVESVITDSESDSEFESDSDDSQEFRE